MDYKQLSKDEQIGALLKRIKDVEQTMFLSGMELGEYKQMLKAGVVLEGDQEAVRAEVQKREAELAYNDQRLSYLREQIKLLRDPEPTAE